MKSKAPQAPLITEEIGSNWLDILENVMVRLFDSFNPITYLYINYSNSSATNEELIEDYSKLAGDSESI